MPSLLHGDHAWANVNHPDITQAADANIQAGTCFIMGFSGKKASGKDTIAQAVAELLRPKYEVELMAYADALKDEASSMMSEIRREIAIGVSESYSAQSLSDRWNVPHEQAQRLVQIIYPQLLFTPPLPREGWARTDSVLKFLQFLGTEVRQSQNQNYWVGALLYKAIYNASKNVTTLVTDVRFHHELKALFDIGAPVIRIDVTQEAQMRRLKARDGIKLPPSALSHLSETALDYFGTFTKRIDNSEDNDLEGKAQLALKSAFPSLNSW